MKTILTALGNPILNNELRKFEKYDVLSEDLLYQEALLDILDEEQADTIVVSSLLQGQDAFYDFIQKIKSKNSIARIIVITDEMNVEDKALLANMGVFDILNDSEVDISDVIDAIDREEPILNSKQIVAKEMDNCCKVMESSTTYITKTQKQEVIVISGTNGSGKSTFAVNFANKLAKESNAEILLIDLDTLNGNIDEILEINKIPQNVDLIMDEDKKCGLNYAADLISKNRFDANVLEEIVARGKRYDVLTGNVSLHYCQNVLNDEYYDAILTAAKEKYDFVIMDTSSNIFLDSTKWALQEASKVIFITENTSICLKKSVQLLNVFLNVWKILKGKVELVIREVNSNGLELEFIEKIFEGTKVIGLLKNNDEMEYEKILERICFVPKQTFSEKLEKVFNKIKERQGKSQVVTKEVQHAN